MRLLRCPRESRPFTGQAALSHARPLPFVFFSEPIGVPHKPMARGCLVAYDTNLVFFKVGGFFFPTQVPKYGPNSGWKLFLFLGCNSKQVPVAERTSGLSRRPRLLFVGFRGF